MMEMNRYWVLGKFIEFVFCFKILEVVLIEMFCKDDDRKGNFILVLNGKVELYFLIYILRVFLW